MVQAGRLHAFRPPCQAVHPQRGLHESHVGRIGQRGLLKLDRVADRSLGAQPDLLARRLGHRLEHVLGIGPAHLDRAALHVLDHRRRHVPVLGQGLFHLGGHRVRGRVCRHRRLVFKALLGHLEGGREVEDLLAVLDRHHPAGGEAAAVARAVDLVQHGDTHIARPDEVGVQAVANPVLDRLVGGHQRLGDDQAAEDPREAVVGRPAPEQVQLDWLKGQGLDEVFALFHGPGIGR